MMILFKEDAFRLKERKLLLHAIRAMRVSWKMWYFTIKIYKRYISVFHDMPQCAAHCFSTAAAALLYARCLKIWYYIIFLFCRLFLWYSVFSSYTDARHFLSRAPPPFSAVFMRRMMASLIWYIIIIMFDIWYFRFLRHFQRYMLLFSYIYYYYMAYIRARRGPRLSPPFIAAFSIYAQLRYYDFYVLPILLLLFSRRRFFAAAPRAHYYY